MMNYKLIERVVKEVAKLYEAEHLAVTNESIRKRTIAWYENTDITEEETLIAAVWIGEYSRAIDYDIILATKDMLFPSVPFEYTEIHIAEIEEALRY